MMQLRFAPKLYTADGSAFSAFSETAAQDGALLAELRVQADKGMNREPLAVTKRKIRAESGDPHDYCSYGPYWWPNPKTENGLPYIRRDGQVNPETNESNTFGALFSAVNTLALAAYYLEDPAYAAKAVDFLRTWYLDPETAMYPNMNYAQAIPGVCTGRGIGIIDINGNWQLLNALGLLDAMGLLPEDVMAGLKAWYGDLLNWMLTSETGVDEDRQHNNHGTWYDVQVASIALFLDRPILADDRLLSAYERRLKKHIEPDGKQPHELARTNALGYSTMNLHGLMLLGKMARLARCKADYWHTPLGGVLPLQAAVDYLAPFTTTLEGFPYQQISGKPATDSMCRLFALAASEYPDTDYAARAAAIVKPNMLWRLWNI